MEFLLYKKVKSRLIENCIRILAGFLYVILVPIIPASGESIRLMVRFLTLLSSKIHPVKYPIPKD
jgi:hypothetical protein